MSNADAFDRWADAENISALRRAPFRRAFFAGAEYERQQHDDVDVAAEVERLVQHLRERSILVIAGHLTHIDGIAALTGKSVRTIERWCEAGIAPAHTHVGRRRVFDLHRLVEWRRANTTFDDTRPGKRVVR